MSSLTHISLFKPSSRESHPPQRGKVFFPYQGAVTWAGETLTEGPSDLSWTFR